MIAALFVEPAPRGVYQGLPNVDAWDATRDARLYAGPWPVVAHPPCERWGRFWHGACATHGKRFLKGDDGGCFVAALAAVRSWGGVLEHPAGSSAWKVFGLSAPPRAGGWVAAGAPNVRGGHVCCVDQGWYGHRARKATWLYAVGLPFLPDLTWGHSPARHLVERMCKSERTATPPYFRDLLIGIAESCAVRRAA